MSKPIDQERADFEAACRRAGLPRPSNFRTESRTYVDERIQGRFEWFQINRAAVQPAGVAVPSDWEDQILESMRAAFDIGRLKDGGLCVDDTQIGVEFACGQLRAMLAAAPHPVSGEQKPVTEFDQDISKVAQAWMKLLGNFGPTVHADKRELKGYTMDSDGDTVKTYYDSGELRELAKCCIEVADWLDRRARQGEQKS